MNLAELVKGKKYNYFDSVINRNETVIYSYAQLNYYVFTRDKTTLYLPHGRVQTNMTEIL